MAILHKATIRPTKAELLERIAGEAVTVLGSYRFDDPAGEVGVEAFVVRCGGKARQIVLTYRPAPLQDAEADLVATMEHSVLGSRWVYDGTRDPVAVACFRRALLGEQEQAVEEIWDGGQRVSVRESTVRLSVVPGRPPDTDAVPVIATDLDLTPEHAQGPRLRAEWDGGDAIVASIG
ncbi:MAG: maltokinase N-terminal cap-like domain-containing protein [Nocardioidaceae bacterium]